MQARIGASPPGIHEKWCSSLLHQNGKGQICSWRLGVHIEHVVRWRGRRKSALAVVAASRSSTAGKIKSKPAQGTQTARSSEEEADPLGGRPDNRGFRTKDYVLFQQAGLENIHALLHGSRYLLAEGDEGDDVKGLQEYLASTGHFKSQVGCTGYFGAATKEAVGTWQKEHGVVISGQFGPISMDMLKALLTKELVKLRKAEERRAEEKRREEKRAEERVAEEKRREERKEQDRLREEKKQEERRLRQAGKGKRGVKEEVVEEVEEAVAPVPAPPAAAVSGKAARRLKSGDKASSGLAADVSKAASIVEQSPTASVAVPQQHPPSHVKLGLEAVGLGFLGTIIAGLLLLGFRELWIVFIDSKVLSRLEGEKREEMREVQRKRFVARVKRIIDEDRDDGPPTGDEGVIKR